MKQSLLIALLLTLTAASFAQTAQTFDIATFRPPAGWKTSKGQDSVQISTANADAFCLMTVFRSHPALSGPKENFAAAWETIVKEAVNVSAGPQVSGPSPTDDGWEAVVGMAPFEKGETKGVATLVTVSGYGKMVNVLILTNTDAYQKEITEFIGSAKLKKPNQGAKAPAAAPSNNSAIVGQWGISSSPQDSFSVNNGLNGYTTREYTFHPNGTYQFLIKLFSYTSRQLLFTKETGTYQLNDDTLTLSPQKGFIQAWTKAMVTGGDGRPSETDNWGKLVSTQNWPLETVTYQISREYMSGTEKWQLRMQSTQPTRRDGPFVGNPAFPNTWFYETVKFPIDPPR